MSKPTTEESTPIWMMEAFEALYLNYGYVGFDPKLEAQHHFISGWTASVRASGAREARIMSTEADLHRRSMVLHAERRECHNKEMSLMARESEISKRESDLSKRESALSMHESELSARESALSTRESKLYERELEHAMVRGLHVAEELRMTLWLMEIARDNEDVAAALKAKWVPHVIH